MSVLNQTLGTSRSRERLSLEITRECQQALVAILNKWFPLKRIFISQLLPNTEVNSARTGDRTQDELISEVAN